MESTSYSIDRDHWHVTGNSIEQPWPCTFNKFRGEIFSWIRQKIIKASWLWGQQKTVKDTHKTKTRIDKERLFAKLKKMNRRSNRKLSKVAVL